VNVMFARILKLAILAPDITIDILGASVESAPRGRAPADRLPAEVLAFLIRSVSACGKGCKGYNTHGAPSRVWAGKG
jgi:hypothetical protein